ncbi:hypothetical protein PG989_007607 [Apiospora arundinis]|uniref:Uncharacterized protein n=1 Tax=Apiospora arundinis TaxID=335852 RepID=A0ABR2IAZ3_9PEZI
MFGSQSVWLLTSRERHKWERSRPGQFLQSPAPQSELQVKKCHVKLPEHLLRISVAGELWEEDQEEQEAENGEQQEDCYEEDDEYEQQRGYYDEEGRDGDDEISQCEGEEESSLEDHSQLEVEATTQESKPLSTPAKSRASTTAATYKDREQGQDQDGQDTRQSGQDGFRDDDEDIDLNLEN